MIMQMGITSGSEVEWEYYLHFGSSLACDKSERHCLHHVLLERRATGQMVLALEGILTTLLDWHMCKARFFSIQSLCREKQRY